MKGIFKNENVYVYINNDEDNKAPIDDVCILTDGKSNTFLYGGRVELWAYYDKVELDIDGISIGKVDGDVSIEYRLSYSAATAYLNQIENLGVDTFLENYKHQLQQLKQEMEKFADDLQQELAVNYDEKKAQELSKYKKFILTLGCVLFALFINMNAGLENQHYISAYENIINSYF